MVVSSFVFSLWIINEFEKVERIDVVIFELNILSSIDSY